MDMLLEPTIALSSLWVSFISNDTGQDGKEMRSKTHQAEMVFVKRLRQVMVAEATAEGAGPRGTFLGRRIFFIGQMTVAAFV